MLEQRGDIQHQETDARVQVDRNKAGDPGTEAVAERGQDADGHGEWAQDYQYRGKDDLDNKDNVHADTQYPQGQCFQDGGGQQLQADLHAVAQLNNRVPDLGKTFLDRGLDRLPGIFIPGVRFLFGRLGLRLHGKQLVGDLHHELGPFQPQVIDLGLAVVKHELGLICNQVGRISDHPGKS